MGGGRLEVQFYMYKLPDDKVSVSFNSSTAHIPNTAPTTALPPPNTGPDTPNRDINIDGMRTLFYSITVIFLLFFVCYLKYTIDSTRSFYVKLKVGDFQ